MKIAIISDTGTQQTNMLLEGVYGTIDRDGAVSSFMSIIMRPFRQESSVRNFHIAPEFAAVSYLFTLLNDGSAPVNVDDAIEITVPDRIAPTLKATIMGGLGKRWTALYDSVAPAGTSPLVVAMLQAEKKRMSDGVDSHLYSQGMKPFVVDVAVKADTRCSSDEYISRQDLVADMAPIDSASFTVTAVRTEDQARAEVVADPDAQWRFEGHHAEGMMHFDMPVFAPSPELAGEFAQFILNHNSMRDEGMPRFLTLKLERVENLRQGEAERFNRIERDGDH